MSANAQSESARAHAITERVTASLQDARAALAAAPFDIPQARVSLAEARGAFVSVQLKALARFVEELEDLLTDIDDRRAPSGSAPVMVESIHALQRFIDALAQAGRTSRCHSSRCMRNCACCEAGPVSSSICTIPSSSARLIFRLGPMQHRPSRPSVARASRPACCDSSRAT
jgi:hypothetical protein